MEKSQKNSAAKPLPSHDDIAHLAGQIWQAEGSPAGRDQEIWLKAKNQLIRGRDDQVRKTEAILADIKKAEDFEEKLEASLSEFGIQPGQRSATSL